MEHRSRSRGFASMAAEKQKEIARKGGRAAHEKGRAHEFTPDEAREAGRKGGEKVSVNRMHMAEIGRRGGRSSASRRRANRDNGSPMDAGQQQQSSSSSSSGNAERDEGMDAPEMMDDRETGDDQDRQQVMPMPEQSDDRPAAGL